MESNHAHAFALIDYAHLPGEPVIPEYDDVINGVTAADVQRVTARYRSPERRYTVVYDPVCTVNGLVMISGVCVVFIVATSLWRIRKRRRRTT